MAAKQGRWAYARLQTDVALVRTDEAMVAACMSSKALSKGVFKQDCLLAEYRSKFLRSKKRNFNILESACPVPTPLCPMQVRSPRFRLIS
jgi:hypothetical protein